MSPARSGLPSSVTAPSAAPRSRRAISAAQAVLAASSAASFFSPLPSWRGQRPDLQRRALPVRSSKTLRGLVPTSTGVVVQPRQHEGARGWRANSAFSAPISVRAGALVVEQRVLGARVPACAQVGVQVGVAEAVDRLLRVADEEQRRAVAEVDALEDRELQRVGVLELVDQRGREALAQRVGEPRARVVAAVRRWYRLNSMSSKATTRRSRLRRRTAAQPSSSRAFSKREPVGHHCRACGGASVEQRLGEFEERVLRRRRSRSSCPSAALSLPSRSSFSSLSCKHGHGVFGKEQALPVGRGGLQQLGLVAVAR